MAIFPYFMYWKCPYVGGWVVQKILKEPLRIIKMDLNYYKPSLFSQICIYTRYFIKSFTVQKFTFIYAQILDSKPKNLFQFNMSGNFNQIFSLPIRQNVDQLLDTNSRLHFLEKSQHFLLYYWGFLRLSSKLKIKT